MNIGIGTTEIEKTAKLIDRKDGNAERNIANVKTVLRRRLKDACKEESVLRKAVLKLKDEIKETIDVKSMSQRIMMKE